MGDESRIRDAAEVVKGIVEAVPIYQDLAQPAVQEVGRGLQTVAKLIHVALTPVSMVVWAYDQIRDYLQETLTEKLKDVPPEYIVQPRMTIAGPTVEHLRFAAEEPTLRELYANLLATSMDARTAEEAHPAFVEVLRQLAPDEARILTYFVDCARTSKAFRYWDDDMTVYVDALLSGQPRYFTLQRPLGTYSIITKAAECTHPRLIKSYLDNLTRLGLLQSVRWGANGFSPDLSDDGATEKRFHNWEELQSWAGARIPGGEITRITIAGHVLAFNFTTFGNQFCSACVNGPKQ